jgi:hypothetical protein
MISVPVFIAVAGETDVVGISSAINSICSHCILVVFKHNANVSRESLVI